MKFQTLSAVDNLSESSPIQTESEQITGQDFGAREYYGFTAFKVLWNMVWMFLDTKPDDREAIISYILQKAHMDILQTTRRHIETSGVPAVVGQKVMDAVVAESCEVAVAYEKELREASFHVTLKPYFAAMLRKTVNKELSDVPPPS